MRAGPVWRTMIVLAVALAAAALALSPFLFRLATKANNEARSAVAANTATICSIGSFLTQSPVTRLPGLSDRDFRRQLFVARAFLVDLRELDCGRGGFGRAVRPQAIERQITVIQHELDQLPRRPTPNRTRDPTGSPADPTSTPTPPPTSTAPPPTETSPSPTGSSGGQPHGGPGGDPQGGSPGPPGPQGVPGPPGPPAGPPPDEPGGPLGPVCGVTSLQLPTC